MGLIRRIKSWLSMKNQQQEAWGETKQQYLEYEVAKPHERCIGHDRSWTGADGIWYCYDCKEWFRVWEDEQFRPERQREGW